MYITFDYKCTGCRKIDTRMVKRSEMDDQHCCYSFETMTRLPAGTRTTFLHADRKLKR